MDITMDSITTYDKTGIKLYHELSTILQSSRIHARPCLYNSTEVPKIIPEADQVDNIDLGSGESSRIPGII